MIAGDLYQLSVVYIQIKLATDAAIRACRLHLFDLPWTPLEFGLLES